jgi:hypothetical protein
LVSEDRRTRPGSRAVNGDATSARFVTFVIPEEMLGLTPTGFELPPKTVGKVPVSTSRGTESGTSSTVGLSPPSALEPGLALVVKQWSRLPAALKDGIVAMVHAADGMPGVSAANRVFPAPATDKADKR